MKIFLFICAWLMATCVRAAVPTFESFSADQFQTNGLRVFYRDPHTNDNGIIYPALANTLTLVTNENVYGTFSLPAKVTLLALGTNYLDVTTNTTWLLNSPTNDPTQVTLSLSAGAYQGQLLFVTSQNGGNSFTLPDLSEQWDTPGAFVDIQGNWVGTTNRGIILQYTAPDWIEMARFDPGQTGGGTVLGGGTPTFVPYWLNASTLADSPLQRFNSSMMQLVNGGATLQFGVSSGASIFSGTAALEFIAGSGVLIMNGGQYLTPAVGGVGIVLGFGTNYYGGLLLGTNGLHGDYTDNGTQLLRNGIPVGGGSGTTINPTDDYIPYRLNATTFSNSQWYVINSTRLGFVTTNFFLTYTNFNLGIGGGTLASLTSGSGNVAIGANSMNTSSGGINNVAIGTSTLSSVTSDNNIAIGQSAGSGLSSGSQNVLIGGNTGLALGTGANSVMVGFQSGLNTSVGNNVFVGADSGHTNTTGAYNTFVGLNANGSSATDTNSIVIGSQAVGHGSNTDTIGNVSSLALYLGSRESIVVGSVTKAQKTALTPADGMIVYQTDNTPGFRGYVNGTWFILSTAADP